jgi:hypothetical protein
MIADSDRKVEPRNAATLLDRSAGPKISHVSPDAVCANMALMQNDSSRPRHRRLWPWFVLIVILLGLLLAILWVSAEARRLQERRKYYIPPDPPRATSTNPPAPTNATPVP